MEELKTTTNTVKMTSMNKYSLAAMLLAGAGFVAACSNQTQKQAPGQQAIPVTTAPVTEEVVVGMDSYPGNVVALNETELRAEVSGYITGIFVADGASVSKGQKLYEIDRTRYAADVEQAKSNLAIAEANLARLQRDVERYRKLAEQDAIAKQTLDYAETDFNNAQAQVASARAALTTAQTNLNRAVIIAPFSGTIGISAVRMGALVSAGSTLLNRISSVDPIAVDFPVNEREIPRFNALRHSDAVVRDSIISITLPGGQAYSHPGKLIAIDRAVDRNTGTITVRASFANPDELLRAGMATTVQVRRQSESKQLVIPYRAVIEQLGQTSVYVLTDSSTVEQRGVRLGLKVADRVVINEGLSGGEQVVTDGTINLRPGAKVQVTQSAEKK
ncbi:efflux RND transporter periplasmic adaptor subunit [Parapedobacter indicus]|uniref:Membrane fusion protein, multidrug efflux system n=1 Tax=Parapedobacter indicus TaxID=1477437 RepID=A0A1I3DIN5_9SPHI|nr:efflux RND transporter periplasmic adaptor subunit [Parapedobacter indicus]PPL04696.1 membrane fusion protein (multidrug efflux system) [Parapedobacter indicus]SFH86610.1 membrane fusion protein, multidrug efflux system [Parapedobacter indicus]